MKTRPASSAAPRLAWPEGKRFAFTAFDDADYDRLINTRPVYDFLADLGLLTTKSVWTLAAQREGPLGGLSTEEPAYLEWTQGLQRAAARGYRHSRFSSKRPEAGPETKRALRTV